jgi:hypothetical protein
MREALDHAKKNNVAKKKEMCVNRKMYKREG